MNADLIWFVTITKNDAVFIINMYIFNCVQWQMSKYHTEGKWQSPLTDISNISGTGESLLFGLATLSLKKKL